jgi:hypothetical protein
MTPARFTPPPDPALDDLARRVCAARAAQQADASLAGWDMAHGLAEFLRAAARIHAEHLNAPAEPVDRGA